MGGGHFLGFGVLEEPGVTVGGGHRERQAGFGRAQGVAFLHSGRASQTVAVHLAQPGDRAGKGPELAQAAPPILLDVLRIVLGAAEVERVEWRLGHAAMAGEEGGRRRKRGSGEVAVRSGWAPGPPRRR